MARKKSATLGDLLPSLKADIEKNVAAYRRAASLRDKKLQQDLEQIRIYIDILENKRDGIKLSKRSLSRLQKLLSPKTKNNKRTPSHGEQQKSLEKHFLRLQKALLALLSGRFDY